MHLPTKSVAEPPARPRGVSQGLLTTFMACRRKAEIQLQGWRKIRPGAALLFGVVGHAVLAEAFQTLKEPPTKDWLKARLRQAVKDTAAEFEGRLSADAVQNLENSAAILLVMLPYYFQKYKKDFGPASWVKIEDEFRVPFPGVSFELYGYFDRVKRVGGKLWLHETKTKSRVDEDYLMESLHFDFQLGYYLQALWLELKEVPAGVVYDILRNPGLEQKKSESFDDYLKRIEADVKKRPEFYFIRFEVKIGKKEVEEFAEQIRIIGGEFEAWKRGELKTFRNTTACKGLWTCDFLPICSRDDYSGFFQKRSGRAPKKA